MRLTALAMAIASLGADLGAHFYYLAGDMAQQHEPAAAGAGPGSGRPGADQV